MKAKVNVDIAQAQAAVSSIRNSLSNLPLLRTITVRTVGVKVNRGTTTANADGGVWNYYANGVFENHVAQIAPANAVRICGEPETGGEAYIPLAQSKRKRSMEIWAETGRRLGVDGHAQSQVRPSRRPLRSTRTPSRVP